MYQREVKDAMYVLPNPEAFHTNDLLRFECVC
jgi:hypothetical protein